MRPWISIPATAIVLIAFRWPQLSWGLVAASVLVALVMTLAVARSTASGPALITSVAGLYFVTSSLINIPEGVVFDVIEPTLAPIYLVGALLESITATLVLVAISGRLRQGDAVVSYATPIRNLIDLLWRLVAVPAVFVVCYFVAGMIIFPYVREFYEGHAMPDPQAIVSMQVLRALAIAGAAYPLLRTLPSRRDAILVLTVAVPVFGAIAPLLPQNDLMPAAVRLVHGMEMAPYYALFGFLIALWFGASKRALPERTSAVVAPAG